MLNKSYLPILLKMNLRELGALRLNALMQVIFMLLNNLIFFVFWVIIYANSDTVRGMQLKDVAFIFGTGASAFGLGAVIFGGAFRIAEQVVTGKLDVYLTQPRSVLLQALTARTQLSGLGDFCTGFILIAFYWNNDINAWLAFLLALICGSIIVISTITIYQSLIFWVPKTEQVSEQFTYFLVSFMVYPPSLFNGVVKAMTYTLLPAAYICLFPNLIVRENNWYLAFVCIAAALVYLQLARLVFSQGLRRYESGNQFMSVR